jgi:hypothetical protein
MRCRNEFFDTLRHSRTHPHPHPHPSRGPRRAAGLQGFRAAGLQGFRQLGHSPLQGVKLKLPRRAGECAAIHLAGEAALLEPLAELLGQDVVARWLVHASPRSARYVHATHCAPDKDAKGTKNGPKRPDAPGRPLTVERFASRGKMGVVSLLQTGGGSVLGGFDSRRLHSKGCSKAPDVLLRCRGAFFFSRGWARPISWAFP